MLNSHSSILSSFSTLDTLVSNMANADVTMSVNFVTLASSFWYVTLIPAKETVPKGIPRGRPMSILNVATFSIPDATLRLFKQAFSHVSQSKALEFKASKFLFTPLEIIKWGSGTAAHFRAASQINLLINRMSEIYHSRTSCEMTLKRN